MIVQILAQAGSDGQTGGGYMQIIFFVGIALVFYFFYDQATAKKAERSEKIYRSNKKRRSSNNNWWNSRKSLCVEEASIVLDIDNKGTKVTFEKSAISLDASNKL